jgi:hypothetical protein
MNSAAGCHSWRGDLIRVFVMVNTRTERGVSSPENERIDSGFS